MEEERPGLGKYILDADGNPQPCDDLFEWAKWFGEGDNRVLRKDEIGNVSVSTVFLGIDHSFFGGPPVLWETMIFGGKHDNYQERHCTKHEALAGHERAVALVYKRS